MNDLFNYLIAYSSIFLLIFIAIYIAISIFLNKFNKLVYGTGTAMCWIPIFNIYLLGKLAINKLVGWVLVICIFLTGSYTITVNGVSTVHAILPEPFHSIVSKLYSIVVLVLFVYAIIKYTRLKNDNSSN